MKDRVATNIALLAWVSPLAIAALNSTVKGIPIHFTNLMILSVVISITGLMGTAILVFRVLDDRLPWSTILAIIAALLVLVSCSVSILLLGLIEGTYSIDTLDLILALVPTFSIMLLIINHSKFWK